jgi:hypothetical protein
MSDERDAEQAGEEIFSMLEYARARLIELSHVLWLEMDEHRCRGVALDFLMAAEWRRRAVRAAVSFLNMTPPVMRVKFDPGGLLDGMVLESCESREAGFHAETVRYVSGPAPIGNGRSKRWGYDFTDKHGQTIRISLPMAIDDLWTTRDTDLDPSPKDHTR